MNKKTIVENLRQLFDTNAIHRNGFMTQTDLRRLCARFDIDASDSDVIFEDLDRDHNGQISFEEFLCGFTLTTDDREGPVSDYNNNSDIDETGLESENDDSEEQRITTSTSKVEANNTLLCSNAKSNKEINSISDSDANEDMSRVSGQILVDGCPLDTPGDCDGVKNSNSFAAFQQKEPHPTVSDQHIETPLDLVSDECSSFKIENIFPNGHNSTATSTCTAKTNMENVDFQQSLGTINSDMFKWIDIETILKESKKLADNSFEGSLSHLIKDLMENVQHLQEENQKLFKIWSRDKPNLETLPVTDWQDEDSHQEGQMDSARFERERQKCLEAFKDELSNVNTYSQVLKTIGDELSVTEPDQHRGSTQLTSLKELLEKSCQNANYFKGKISNLHQCVQKLSSEQRVLKEEYMNTCESLEKELAKSCELQQDNQKLKKELTLLKNTNHSLQSSNNVLQQKMLAILKESTFGSSSSRNMKNLDLKPTPALTRSVSLIEREKFCFRKRNSFMSDYLSIDRKSNPYWTIKNCQKIVENDEYSDGPTTGNLNSPAINIGKTNLNSGAANQDSIFPSMEKALKRTEAKLKRQSTISANYMFNKLSGQDRELELFANTAQNSGQTSTRSTGKTFNQWEVAQNRKISFGNSKHDDAWQNSHSLHLYRRSISGPEIRPYTHWDIIRRELCMKQREQKYRSVEDSLATNMLPKSENKQTNLTSPVQMKNKHVFKIILVGDSTVGKTTFIYRATKGVFLSSVHSTIGIDFETKQVTVDGREYEIQLWDTAGQERYHSITANYFRKVDGICLMYDVTKVKTFLSVRNWINSIQETVNSPVILFILANKVDLRQRASGSVNSVSYETASKLLEKVSNATIIEVSCKTGYNVDYSLMSMVKQMINQETVGSDHETNIRLHKVKKSKENCCAFSQVSKKK